MEDFNFESILVNIVTDEITRMIVAATPEGRKKILKCIEVRDKIFSECSEEERQKNVKKFWALISKAGTWTTSD